jgi:SMODS and SLOG-associating 2TM effector domain 3/SMODS and SLOG-associating 2TM effector domain 1
MNDDRLPAAYRMVDGLAAAAQDRSKLAARRALMLGVAAAVCGTVNWRLGACHLDVIAGIGMVAFAGVFLLTWLPRFARAEDVWAECRSTAEEIKARSWLFAMGANPYPVTLSPANAERMYIDDVKDLWTSKSNATTAAIFLPLPVVTDAMRSMRVAPVADRRIAYERARIRTQAAWYEKRALENKHAAKKWIHISLAANTLGFVAGGFRLMNAYNFDLLGVFAAISGSSIAWTRTRQHGVLQRTYTETANQLVDTSARLQAITSEAEWANEIADIDATLTREHHLWLTRRPST